MDVGTLCNKYQRKMWQSMISRKKLDFSIWDAILLSNEKVYYMPYSKSVKIEITNRYCYNCNNEITISFIKNEFTANTCVCSKDDKCHATIQKLSTLFDKNTAAEIIQNFSDKKTRNLPNKLHRWVSQGYTEIEATEMIRMNQTVLSNRSPSSKKGVREYSTRCVEYWVKRGYSAIEAQRNVSSTQIGNGLKWYIARYGEIDGHVRYDERIKKWMASYIQALKNDPTIMERKLVKFGCASKESLGLFQPLYDKYKDKFKIYLGITDNVEYFLRNEETIFFYDFTIPQLKLIVEYNGSVWHPNKELLTSTQLLEWKNVYTNAPASVVLAIDEAKRKLAESNGYTVIVIWDTDDVTNSIKKIENIIEGKYES